MKKVEVFETADGTWHSTEEQAKHHELISSIEQEIDDFFKSEHYPYRDYKTSYGAVVKKCLIAWVIYKGPKQ